MTTEITTTEMRRRIGAKFGRSNGAVSVPEHLVFHEVSAADPDTTYRRLRRIDVVAVGMLRRTDHLIHGFEIKVSRADLRQELREPAKARTGALYCDRWWLALSDRGLLRDSDDLPDGWGVLAAYGRGLRVHVEPKPIVRVESPEFRAALLHAGARSPSYRYAMGFQAGLVRGQKHSQSVIDDAYRRGNTAGYIAGLHEGREKATA